MHIVPGSQLVSHVLLKERTALERGFSVTSDGRHPEAELVPAHILRADENRAIAGKSGKKVRKVLPYDGRSTRQQRMHVFSLRYPFAWLSIVDQSIALDRGDLCKMVREDTSGQQPGHTSADDDGVAP